MNGAIAVAQGSTTIYANGFGIADQSANKHVLKIHNFL